MRSVDVLVIGAGFGGIAMAKSLDDLGIDDYLIVEKADTVGGTWRDNTYPGAACDVPSHLYSLSFAPNAHWTRLFSRQAEIRAHIEKICQHWMARGRIALGWQLRSLDWDATSARWRAENASGDVIEARSVVSAMGGLHVPSWPNIPGRDTFAGAHCHSARWDHDIQFAGQRVGVIGTGTSAIQIVPELAKSAGALHVFQRTPVWILPRPDVAIPRWTQHLLALIPPLRLGLRAAIYLQLEMLSLALLRPRTAFWARAWARWNLRRHVADPSLHAALTPDYALGCKRIALSSDFYPALARDNVSLQCSEIAAIEPQGMRMRDGRLIELDVLVFATGFRPMDLLANVRISGTDGVTLNAAWADRPHTANGVAVHGFPNLFFLLGPNTALGHNSVLYMIESQARHIAALLRRMRADGHARVEATAAAEQRFMTRIDAAFPHTAWAGGCQSWYLDAKRRNFTLWVGSSLGYRWRLWRSLRRDYQLR